MRLSGEWSSRGVFSRSLLPHLMLRVRSLLYVGLSLTLFFTACTSGNEAPTVEVDVARSEVAMRKAMNDFGTDTSLAHRIEVYNQDLKQFGGFYSFFMQSEVPLSDTILASIFGDFSNPRAALLIDTVLKAYPERYDFRTPFGQLFGRVKQEYPDFKVPQVVTYVTGYPREAAMTFDVDQLYMNQQYVGIGLHYFMGPDFGYPQDLPRYLRQHLTKEQIVPRVAFRLTDAFQPRLNPMKLPSLIDWMVFYGLKYHFLDVVLPETADSIKLQYTRQQMDWAVKNETAVYREMLPQLYDKIPRNISRWLNPGPFTSGLPQESADRLGHYIGMKIVRSYIKRNGLVQLKELMKRQDYQKIFEESGYKP
jgi:hypothetical protein